MLTSFSTALAVSGFLVGSCTSVCVCVGGWVLVLRGELPVNFILFHPQKGAEGHACFLTVWSA